MPMVDDILAQMGLSHASLRGTQESLIDSADALAGSFHIEDASSFVKFSAISLNRMM